MHLEASGRHSFLRARPLIWARRTRTLSKKKEHKSKLAWRLRCIIHAPLLLETANSSGHWRLTEEPPVSVHLAPFDILFVRGTSEPLKIHNALQTARSRFIRSTWLHFTQDNWELAKCHCRKEVVVWHLWKLFLVPTLCGNWRLRGI